MNDLKSFVARIPEFDLLGPGLQIQYFVYFLQIERQLDIIKAKDIVSCFDVLHLNPYSNIPNYLVNYSRKGSRQQFLQKNGGVILFSLVKKRIDAELEKAPELLASNSLFPMSIFDNTRKYLIEFAKEAGQCYDLGLYNSALFMLRKITETLIIELYESKGLQAKIKNANGDYFQLSELIKAVISESSWKLSKIVKENLPKIKLLADSSVHSKRFSAKKPDIDVFKTDIRIAFEELISHIDYSKWNGSK